MDTLSSKSFPLWALLAALALLPCLIISYESRYDPRHSFKSPFLLVRGTYLPYWEFGGSAVVTEEYVRLTPAIKSRTGSIWNSEPVYLHDWEIIIEFRVGGGGKLGADGLAFWYTPDIRAEGPVFGMKDYWRGLGIIFDTFDNDGMRDNPQVVAIMNDGTREYGDREDGKHIQFGGCHSQFRNPYKNVKAKIRHFGEFVEVQMDTTGTGVWEPCVPPTQVDMPVGWHFGLTAKTGGLFDNHDVYSFETFNIGDQQQQPPEQQQQQQQGQPVAQPPQQEQQQPRADNNNNNQGQFRNGLLERLNNIANEPATQQQPRSVDQNQVPVPPQNAPPVVSTPPAAQQQTPPVAQQQVPPVAQQQAQPDSQQQQQQQGSAQSSNKNEVCGTDSSDLAKQLSDLSSKVAALQQTLSQMNFGGATDVKRELDQIKQQQSVFAEGFVDLLQAIATKSEIADIRSRSESLHQSVVKEIGDTRVLVQDLKALVNTRVGKGSEDLIRTLEDVNQNVNQLKKDVGQTKDTSQKIATSLKQTNADITTTIEKHTTFGFWTYFLFVQAIFIFGYIWWRKHREDTSKKLL